MSFNLRKIKYLIALTLLTGGILALAKDVRKSESARKPPITRAELKLVDRRDGELIIEWQCPEVVLTRQPESGAVSAIDMVGADPLIEVGVPQLPILVQLLDCLPGQVTATILDAEVETRHLGDMLPMSEDVPVDLRTDDDDEHGDRLDDAGPSLTWDERRAATPLHQGTYPESQLAVSEAGVYRGHRLVAIKLHPVQVNPERGTARIVKRARIRVLMPRAESNSDLRLADSPRETQLVRNLLGTLAPTALATRMTEARVDRDAHAPRLDDLQQIGGRWKLSVNQEGIIRVGREQLLFAGVPVDAISTFDAHLYNRGHETPIYFEGETDGHFDEFDYIEFWGVPNRQTFQHLNPVMYTDPWSDDNIYWLSWGDGQPGMRLGQQSLEWRTLWAEDTSYSNRIRPVTSIRTKLHFEKDLEHDRLAASASNWGSLWETRGPLGIQEDHWFWGGHISGLSLRNFSVSLPFPNTNSFNTVTVRAAFQGSSYPSSIANSGYHRVSVFLNGLTAPGLTVGKVSLNDNNINWRGQTPLIIETTSDSIGITTDQLQDGTNTITVSLPGDGLSGANDKVYVNWFELEYDREMRASKGFVTFDLSSIVRLDTTIGDTLSIDLRGFVSQDIKIWDILGNVQIRDFDVRYVSPRDESPSWAARFQLIVDRDYRFYAYDERAPIAPVAIMPEVSTRDLRAETGAEYLMIYHDSFLLDNVSLASLARLDSLRQQSFLFSTLSIPLNEVYEQFSDGIVTPLAIHDFITYAYDHWQVRPTHLCLIGDGVLDTKGYTGTGNMIPPIYSQTGLNVIGIVAADMFFGCVSGPPSDVLPDVAVGRISARSAAELQTYVDKVLIYESTSDFNTYFHGNVLFVADAFTDYNFAGTFSEPVIRVLNNDVIISRVYLDSLGAGQGPSVLRDAIRNGAVIVNYNGHGGGGVWSNTDLLNVAGVRQLRNRRGFPFITNFTCFVGAYDDRDQTKVLGEALLFSRNNDGDLVGGIGAYSSTGVGWIAAGIQMQKVLFDYISVPPGMTLGEIVNRNKMRFWASLNPIHLSWSGSPYSQLVSMSLLGDPGLQLRLPQGPLQAVSADTSIVDVSEADTVRIAITLPWIPGASPSDVYLLPFNGERFWYRQNIDTVHDTTYYTLGGFLSSKVPAFTPQQVEPRLMTQQQDTFDLVIGPRFSTPLGRIIVYAVDLNQRRDAISALPIFNADSLGTIRVYDVDVLPSSYILNDSAFQVQARIMHINGVEAVRMRGIFRPAQGPIVLDTLGLEQVETGLWRSALLGPYHTQGGSYQVTFYVKPFGEDWQSTDLINLTLEEYSDFRPDTTFGRTARMIGIGRPYFYLPVAHVRSGRTRPIPELEVQLTGIADSSYYVHEGEDSTLVSVVIDSFTTSIRTAIPDQSSSLTELLLPAVTRPLAYHFTIIIDPNNEVAESNEENNTFLATLNPPKIYAASNVFGSYYLHPLEQNVFHRHWQSGVDTLRLRLAPGSLSQDTAAIAFRDPVFLSAADSLTQRSRGLLPIANNRRVRVYHTQLGDSSEALGSNAEVEVLMSISSVSAAVIPQLAIFQKRKESPTWRRLEDIRFDTLSGGPQFYSGRMHGIARGLGDFAIFRVSDDEGPLVDISVDGMSFTPGSILPRRPAIYANLSDPNGIDRCPACFYAVLDGDTIPTGEMSWSDSLMSGGNMSALFRPQLEPGQHTLLIHATDNAGVSTDYAAEFEVRGEFGIEWAINYPNPFAQTTSISYLLTDVTDQFVEVKIYTVAGRKIRTLREVDPTVVNYRSIEWDGRDETGEEVANGVYFARLKAKQGDHEVEKTIKMAKIR